MTRSECACSWTKCSDTLFLAAGVTRFWPLRRGTGRMTALNSPSSTQRIFKDVMSKRIAPQQSQEKAGAPGPVEKTSTSGSHASLQLKSQLGEGATQSRSRRSHLPVPLRSMVAVVLCRRRVAFSRARMSTQRPLMASRGGGALPHMGVIQQARRGSRCLWHQQPCRRKAAEAFTPWARKKRTGNDVAFAKAPSLYRCP